MSKHFKLSRAIWPSIALAGAFLLTTHSVFAGECPADKVKPNARQVVDYKPVGVTDVTLGSIDLEKQPANIRDRELASASSRSSRVASCRGIAMTIVPL